MSWWWLQLLAVNTEFLNKLESSVAGSDNVGNAFSDMVRHHHFRCPKNKARLPHSFTHTPSLLLLGPSGLVCILS